MKFNSKLFLFLVLIFCIFFIDGKSQTIVGTEPVTKIAILEEFTGVRCGYCPDGHRIAREVIAEYPDRSLVIAFHPSNSGLTDPIGNDIDLRRSYTNAFYDNAFIGERYMPGAMINRRKYTVVEKRMVGRHLWKSKVESIITERSPVNIGITSSYSEIFNTLSINLELYYISDVSEANRINIFLIEDGLITRQSGTNGNYEHKNIFREHITEGQWGELVTGSRREGSLYTAKYVFDLSGTIDPVNIENARVVAFVTNNSNKEIYSGTVVEANQLLSDVNNIENNHKIKIYPNPCGNVFRVDFSVLSGPVNIQITDVSGHIIQTKRSENETFTDFNITNLPGGLYFVKILTNNSTYIKKLIKQ